MLPQLVPQRERAMVCKVKKPPGPTGASAPGRLGRHCLLVAAAAPGAHGGEGASLADRAAGRKKGVSLSFSLFSRFLPSSPNALSIPAFPLRVLHFIQCLGTDCPGALGCLGVLNINVESFPHFALARFKKKTSHHYF